MNRYWLKCPSCKKQIAVNSKGPPVLKCGDCLMDKTEVVELVVTEVLPALGFTNVR